MEVGMAIHRLVSRRHRSESGFGVERRVLDLVTEQPASQREREIDLADAGLARDQPGVAKASGTTRGFELRQRRLEPREQPAAQDVDRRRHCFADANRFTSAVTSIPIWL
jgi:hypothetical protein